MTALATITLAELAATEAELRRELGQRRAVYPGRVAARRMLQAEADDQLALAAAWIEDAARVRTSFFSPPWSAPVEPAHGLSWRVRRSGLLRELALRGRFFPGWIAKGKLTSAQADHRIACLERLLELYEDGWDWCASNGRRGNNALAVRDPLERAAWHEFEAIRADRLARTAEAVATIPREEP